MLTRFGLLTEREEPSWALKKGCVSLLVRHVQQMRHAEL